MRASKRELIGSALLADKHKKADAYAKTMEEDKLRIQGIVESSRVQTQPRCWTTLEYCTPGTRFEVSGLPSCRGCLISLSNGSARVLLDDGTDTRIAQGTEVFLGAPKPQPKQRKQAAAESKAQETPQRRPRVLGYTSVRMIYWCGAQGWDFDKVKLLFEVFEVPISETTIKMTLESVNDPRYFDPAKVTEEDAKKIYMAIE